MEPSWLMQLCFNGSDFLTMIEPYVQLVYTADKMRDIWHSITVNVQVITEVSVRTVNIPVVLLSL